MKTLCMVGCVIFVSSLQLQGAQATIKLHQSAGQILVKPVTVRPPTRPDSPYPVDLCSSSQVKPVAATSTNDLPVLAEGIPPVEPLEPLRSAMIHETKKSCSDVSGAQAVYAYLIGMLMYSHQKTLIELAEITDAQRKDMLIKKMKDTAAQIEVVMHIAAHTNQMFKHMHDAYHGKTVAR